MSLKALRKTRDLRFWSLLYLMLPIWIFFLSWMHLWLGTILMGLSIWGMSIALADEGEIRLEKRQLWGIGLLGLVLAVLAGMGGFPQQHDYLKHNQLWLDLVRYPWPIGYEYQGDAFALCYYLAYYLPSALAAKAFGLGSLGIFSFLWGTMGICLMFAWGIFLTNKKSWLVILCLVLFGGQDFLWRIVVELRFFLIEGYWEKWVWDEMGLPYGPGLGHKLPMHFGSLSWAPQHLLPGAIATAWAYHSAKEGQAYRSIPLLLAILLLWSPFLLVGLLPFAMFSLINEWRKWIKRTWFFVPALFIGLVLGLYFLSHESLGQKGWIWGEVGDVPWALYLLFFSLMKFLPLSLLLIFIYSRKKREHFDRSWLLMATAMLILSQFYYMGYSNDLYMRATIPAWFLMSCWLVKEMLEKENKKKWRWLLLAWFVGGGIIPMTTIFEHGQALLGIRGEFVNSKADPGITFIQIDELYRERQLIAAPSIWEQYVGEPEAFFFHYLSPPLHFQPANKIPDH